MFLIFLSSLFSVNFFYRETAEDIPHVSLPVADRKRITTLLSIKSKQEYWSDSLRYFFLKKNTYIYKKYVIVLIQHKTEM